MIYSKDEALNRPPISKEWEARAVAGSAAVARWLLENCLAFARDHRRPCLLALDGYLAVQWRNIVAALRQQAVALGSRVSFLDVSCCLRSPAEIEKLVLPYLEADPFFGRVFPGKLEDLFDSSKLSTLRAQLNCLRGESYLAAVICYGAGAALPALAGCYDFLAYFDTTRESIANRLLNGQLLPAGMASGGVALRRLMKRLSYVDIGVFNKHKKAVLAKAAWYVDANDEANLKLIPRRVYDELLAAVARGPFRLKPLYIPGVWGGQFLKKHRGLPAEMVNCSFALEVVPQLQSLRLAIGPVQLEVPFSNLLWREPMNVVGRKCLSRFGCYFPISHNYDDTCGGGNLAIQVHPDGQYLRNKFGERLRRDESYYIVQAHDGARTYHGLKEDADVGQLRRLAIHAERENIPFDYDQYIHSWPSRPGDLLLIPAGTVHASGANQLVLEIDSDPGWTGQEYTFHIYDYLRPDLDGSLRDIHIEHAFSVLRPERRATWVGRRLKQNPKLLRHGCCWAEYNLGECRQLYYTVHRLEFDKSMEDNTKGCFHVLTLVEGEGLLVRVDGHPARELAVRLTESLIVPASAGKYRLMNLGKAPCKVVKSLMK